jgi:hypothetical protein
VKNVLQSLEVIEINQSKRQRKMKTVFATIAIIIGTLVLFQNCEYDKEALISVSNCSDTANISFAERIEPLLRTSCFSCHGNGANEGDVSLETYDNVKTLALNGRLLGAISHSAGFAAMPEGAEKLGDCSIEAVRVWIEQGARDN